MQEDCYRHGQLGYDGVVQMSERLKGTMTRWFPERGFGFVQTSDGKEHFCHVSAFSGEFEPIRGDKIEFEIEPGNDGRPRACKAMILR
jgi:cold shock CspA family protein